MGRSFDVIVIAGSLLVGILLLTGNGDFLMKTKNTHVKSIYDEKKMQKVFGICFLIAGAITAVDTIAANPLVTKIYLAALVLDFAISFTYVSKKCKK